MPASNPQPIEIPWTRLVTTRPTTSEDLEKARPGGTTITIFSWEPEQSEAYPDKRVIYYKVTVSFGPFTWTAGVAGQLEEFLRERFGAAPTRMASLYLRVTSDDKKSLYFNDAVPRRRVVTESTLGKAQVSSLASGALAIGKSTSTIHDQTKTGIETTSDPGTSWGFDVGVFSVGGSGDTTQDTDTTVTRDATQTLDVTQRDAAAERRDLYSYTTRLTNALSVLDVSHIGSSDLRFMLWAPPISAFPSVVQGDPDRAYADALRWRSSGLTGVQEFFAVAVAERASKVCVEALLDTVHVLDPGPPPLPSPRQNSQDPSDSDVDYVLDYLFRKYPTGFPLDDLDVDITEAVINPSGEPYDQLRNSCVLNWYILKAGVFSVVMVSGTALRPAALRPPSGLDPVPASNGWSVFFTASYKLFSSVWLDASREEYDNETASFSGSSRMLPVSLSLSAKACERTGLSLGSAPARLIEMDWRKVQQAPTSSAHFRALDNELRMQLERGDFQELPLATLRHPEIRDAVLAIAAEADSEIGIEHASELGLPDALLDTARKKGLSTLGQLARQLRQQKLADRVSEERKALEAALANTNLEEPTRMPLKPPSKRSLVIDFPAGWGASRERQPKRRPLGR